MAAKNTIATICRALCIKNHNDVYNLEKMEQIKHEFDADPEMAKAKYPEVFYYFDGLVDCVVSQSQHPAGIVASPVNLIDFCGAFIGSDGQQILALDMDQCHNIGLIKYDILGLKTIGVIDKTCRMIGQYFPAAHEINFDDQAVFEDMSKNPATIFQFESSFAADCFKQMHCTNIDDISIVTAAIRPGSASYRDRILRKEVNDNGSEIINDLLKNSYGYCLFQEDVIAFLQKICGFSGSDADSIRRAIGKKQRDKIEAAMPQILEGYCSKSDKPREVAEEEAKKFLQVIEDSSSYAFNYNHALGYSLLSYLCGYYRHYYPVEYCTAYLTCANNDDDIANGLALAQSLGIENLSIQFGHSSWDYSYDHDGKKIYRGLSSIPFMSKPVVDCMVEEAYNKTYLNFVDVIIQLTVMSSKMNSRQLEVLIKLDFFSNFGSINYLLRILQNYKKFKTRKKCFDLIREAAESIPFEEKTPVYDLIKYEYDVTKILTRVFPALTGYYFITEIKGGQYVMYDLGTGRNVKYKIRKKTLESNLPIAEGDIIKVLDVKPEGKWYKDANDKWVQSKDNFEDVVKNFTKVKNNVLTK